MRPVAMPQPTMETNMTHSAVYAKQNQAPHNRAQGKPRPPLYVTVRAGLAACPPIDMSALQRTAEVLHATLEDLDGACG